MVGTCGSVTQMPSVIPVLGGWIKPWMWIPPCTAVFAFWIYTWIPYISISRENLRNWLPSDTLWEKTALFQMLPPCTKVWSRGLFSLLSPCSLLGQSNNPKSARKGPFPMEFLAQWRSGITGYFMGNSFPSCCLLGCAGPGCHSHHIPHCQPCRHSHCSQDCSKVKSSLT